MIEPPGPADGPIDRNRTMRGLHRASGIVIAVFLVLHIGNHLAMFWGQEAHITAMESLRPLYRNVLAETLLMAALAFQIGSGGTMVWRTRSQRRGRLARAQAGSGIILALFVVNHVAAVWIGRIVFGLDTNYHFAAAGFHAGYAGFFVPYYFLGVSAAFVHLACALAWRVRGKALPTGVAVVGVGLAGGFVAVMAGDPAIPASYLASFP